MVAGESCIMSRDDGAGGGCGGEGREGGRLQRHETFIFASVLASRSWP